MYSTNIELLQRGYGGMICSFHFESYSSSLRWQKPVKRILCFNFQTLLDTSQSIFDGLFSILYFFTVGTHIFYFRRGFGWFWNRDYYFLQRNNNGLKNQLMQYQLRQQMLSISQKTRKNAEMIKSKEQIQLKRIENCQLTYIIYIKIKLQFSFKRSSGVQYHCKESTKIIKKKNTSHPSTIEPNFHHFRPSLSLKFPHNNFQRKQ